LSLLWFAGKSVPAAPAVPAWRTGTMRFGLP
jgi:hypothetical protein